MSVPELLPPRDLLDQVTGVEQGLRRGHRARVLGLLLAAIQATLLVWNSPWLGELINGDWNAVLDQWPLLVCLFGLILSVFAFTWARFWLRESKQPFRYTFSIAPFAPLAGASEEPRLAPLHADVQENLSLRIPRLSLLEEPEPSDHAETSEGVREAAPDTHVQVHGNYAVRMRPPDQRWVVEVTPWVTVGVADQGAKLAVPIKYALPVEASESSENGGPPALDVEQYGHIVERTYFSIATEIYRQIKADVARKIDLLPSRWFRATALLHEAGDYARSNTLDAYEQARDLYSLALEWHDPTWGHRPESRLRQSLAGLRARLFRLNVALRRWGSRLIPRLGRPEVLAARAQVGYANTLLETATLANLSGLKARAVFEAAPVVRRAADRLKALPADVPDRHASLFEANVCLARSEVELGQYDAAATALSRARASDPRRAEEDSRFLFVRGLLETRTVAQIPLFQSTVDHAPRSESARFQLAYSSEMLWRTRPTLEESVARTVMDQYAAVLKLNPGSVGAWANRGYIAWLLEAQTAEARRSFEGGRRFKEIKNQAYVAEIDHGLARIAAEEGQFEEAYSRYIDAVSARIAHGWQVGQYEDYYFERISAAILLRFKRYCDRVAKFYKSPPDEQLERTSRRVRASVYAFALNDFAQACFMYYRRAGDPKALDDARAAFTKATELNERFVLPWLNLAYVEGERERLHPVEPDGQGRRHGACLDKVNKLQPAWPEAGLKLLVWYGQREPQARAEASAKHEAAREKRRQADAESAEIDKAAQSAYGDGFGPPVDADRPRQLREEADRDELEAARLEDEANKRAKNAAALIRDLVPQEWLWRSVDGGSADDFNWDAIDSAEARRELRWERSLESGHVDALVAWGKFLSQSDRPPPRLEDLLDLIEERLWPNDFGLISWRLERANAADDGGAQDFERRIDAMVQRGLETDPEDYLVLTWLDDRTASAERLIDMAWTPGLSPFVYRYIGGRLAGRLERAHDDQTRAAAVEAFNAAGLTTHGGTLLEVGDGFSALELPEQARKTYRRAARYVRDPDTIMLLAQRFEGLRELETALDLGQRAAKADKGAAPLHADEYYNWTLGGLFWAVGEEANALEAMRAIPRDGETLGPTWRGALIVRLRDTLEIPSPAVHARLRAWLIAAHRDAVHAPDQTAGQDAGDAAAELALGRYACVLRRLDSDDPEQELRVPVATPITLAANEEFFPQGADTPAVQVMIDDQIPAIRESIRARTGVVVPGFRIRARDDFPPRTYRVLINEVPVESAIVPDTVQDPYAQMLEAVALAVEQRLSSFVQRRFVDELLAEQAPDVVQRALPGEFHVGAFHRLLKELVADGVPIGDLSVPLAVCAASDVLQTNTADLAKEVRRRRRFQLPGQDARQVPVPEALEADLLASSPLDPDLVVRARQTIHELVATASPPIALVASTSQARMLVRKIAAVDFPTLPVLDREEVTPPMAEAPQEPVAV